MQRRSYYYTLILFFCLNGFSGRSQGMFDINTIRTIEINFYAANWDYLLDSLASLNAGTGSGTERILASVVIDGTVFDSCGVRYKGNSSMDTASNKNPFNIDLNYTIPGQRYMGKDKIKLANNFSDPSMVREALMYEISNQYMDCPHASFVKVYILGDYRGIYTNTESIDNEFLEEYYGSSANSFFKCDPISFQFFGDNSNMAFHVDSIAYDTLYDKKSLYGLQDLQDLAYQLEFNTANIEQYLDVDRALWFLALSSAFVHNDGYTAFGHNYYLYKMDNGRWSIILWDVNMSFGGLLWNGTNVLPLALGDLQTQDPYLHQLAFNFKPLIARLLTIPKYRKMYNAHYKTIMEENVTNNYYLQRAEFMSALIDSDAQNEPYNQYTYTEFTDNIYNDVGTWVSLRPGLQNLMQARGAHIDTLPEFQYAQPTIGNVIANPSQPQWNSQVVFNAEVTNASTVTLAYRYNKYAVFAKVQMFDDGLNNDNAAGDGIYGVELPVFNSEMQYYIYAENAQAGKFSPVRAEYEFYTLTPQPGLVLNEFMATNTMTAYDEFWELDDWIELYNNTTSGIDLNGYYLSDSPGNLNKWVFPDTLIGPGEYLIVWADNDTLQPGLHANFSLSSLGEGIYLSDYSGNLIDGTTYAVQTSDISYGRFVNGTGNFTLLYPTFSGQNTTPLVLEENDLMTTVIYPNPSDGKTTILFEKQMSGSVQLVHSSGKVVLRDQISNKDEFTFDVSNFESGLYFVMVGTHVKKLMVR